MTLRYALGTCIKKPLCGWQSQGTLTTKITIVSRSQVLALFVGYAGLRIAMVIAKDGKVIEHLTHKMPW